MSSAGQQLIANRVPGERIGTTINTANSAAITTVETIVDTVTVPLVSGRTYRITWAASILGTVANDQGIARMREDNVAGTTLQVVRFKAPTATNYPLRMEAEFTAVATGNKTFVVCLLREVGTLTRIGNATQPVYLYVDYIRG